MNERKRSVAHEARVRGLVRIRDDDPVILEPRSSGGGEALPGGPRVTTRGVLRRRGGGPLFVWAMSLTVLVLMTGAVVGRPEEREDGETAFVRAAGRRGDRVRSFDARLKRSEMIPRGALFGRGLAPDAGKVLVPDRDLTLTSEVRFVVSGLMARYEENRPLLHPSGKFSEREAVHVTDGEEGRSFVVRGFRIRGRPVGTIEPHAGNPNLRNDDLWPLSIHLRGLEPSFVAEVASAAKPTGRKVTIEGASCLEYRFPEGAARTSRTVYVDPALDHSVRRVRVEHSGKVRNQQDVSYQPHPVLGHVPRRWVHHSFLADGTLHQATTVELSDLTLNLDRERGFFRYPFPPGAVVVNHKAGGADSLVQPDGSLAPFTRPDGEEPDATPGDPAPSRSPLWTLTGAVTVCLAGVYYLARRRRPTAPAPPPA